MIESRKFYSSGTQVYERLEDEGGARVDKNVGVSMSRGMAFLIAKLLTEHFEREAQWDGVFDNNTPG